MRKKGLVKRRVKENNNVASIKIFIYISLRDNGKFDKGVVVKGKMTFDLVLPHFSAQSLNSVRFTVILGKIFQLSLK